MISEGDLFAIVIGPSSLVVDGDVTFADDLIKALLDSDADPAAEMLSAVETARMFGLDDLVAFFDDR